jgi:hypothetical protein
MKKKRRTISNFEEVVCEIKNHGILELKFMFPELTQGKAKGSFIRGRLYFIECPFHQEKTPSFCIYDNRPFGGFKCFGCGAAGSIIDYYMSRKDVSFVEAVIVLCRIFKIKIKWKNID